MGYPADFGRDEYVLSEIHEERKRQDAKWGEQNHPNGTGTRLDETLAALSRAECQRAANVGSVTYRLILDEEVREAFAESDPAKLRAELVQVAAVAVAWIEAIDRREYAALAAKEDGRG